MTMTIAGNVAVNSAPLTPQSSSTMTALFAGNTTLPYFGINTHAPFNTGPPDANNVQMAQFLGASVVRIDAWYWSALETSSQPPTATNGATAAGNNTLHFATTPSGITGMTVGNPGNSTSIPPGTTILSVTGTTAVMSNNAAGPGVSSGNTITFYNFVGGNGGQPESVLAALAAGGFVINLVFPSGNTVYESTVETGITDATGIAAYAAACAAVVYRYATLYGAGNIIFEFWNEENFNTNWAPTASASQFATLVNAAVTAIIAVVPGAQLITGGLTFGGSGFVAPDTYGATLVSDLTLTNIAGIGAHPYNSGAASEALIGTLGTFNTAISGAKPIHATEAGYQLDWVPNTSETIRAFYTARLLLCAITSQPQPAGISIYDLYMAELSNNPTAYNADFGLFAFQSFAPLPSGRAFAAITAACAGMVTNDGAYNGSDLTSVTIHKASSHVRIVWVGSAAGAYNFTQVETSISTASATDVFGTSVPVVVSGNTVSFHVSAASGPVILTVT